jgi:hypothetical protein
VDGAGPRREEVGGEDDDERVQHRQIASLVAACVGERADRSDHQDHEDAEELPAQIAGGEEEHHRRDYGRRRGDCPELRYLCAGALERLEGDEQAKGADRSPDRCRDPRHERFL